MERALKELEKVRTSPEPDAVHDLRVALRRCRSVAAVMEEVDPDRSWREMRKLGRKLFGQLGDLRMSRSWKTGRRSWPGKRSGALATTGHL